MNRGVVLLLSVFLFAAGGSLFYARHLLNTPLAVPPRGLVLDVASGTPLRALAEDLARDGVLGQPGLLVAYGRVTGKAAQIKAGEYEIAAGTTAQGLLEELVAGHVKLHSLTIVEGWTVRDVLAAIRKNSAIRQTLPEDDVAAVSRALDLQTSVPEGWFYPDTYKFPRDTPDIALLKMAYERMRVVLERAWSGRQVDLPLSSAYDALILASIVEKETSLDRERPLVAGVFIRRLRAGMRLQTDPTVIYGLGEDFSGDLTRRHLSRDSPYNTYIRSGLPPSPISLPAESSILAVLHPDDSDALYFVASGDADGSHVFSATLRDHNAAVRRYLQASRADQK